MPQGAIRLPKVFGTAGHGKSLKEGGEAGSESPRLPAKVAALCCRTQAQNGDIL